MSVLWSSLILAQSFSTLSYNVAGLLEPFSSNHPSVHTKLISCMVRDYSIVNVQEDFNYHADLYDTCDDHPFRTPTSGGMGIGSGLNTLSSFPYQDMARNHWSACNGVDCLTPKGWTFKRVRLTEGVYLSVYNLHAQAQTEDKDLKARRENILQLLADIETRSPHDAVLVMGDTNTRYTRSGDNIGEFLNHGFHDVWIDLVRDGQIPERGAPALTDCTTSTSAACEVVDKVFYRNNRLIQLVPHSYQRDDKTFVDGAGEQLSDHIPIAVSWEYELNQDWRASDLFGGPHGDMFQDLGQLTAPTPVKYLSLRSGSRVDRVEIGLQDGRSLGHGGSGGRLQTLVLEASDYLVAAKLCVTEVSGNSRIAYADFETKNGQHLIGGKSTRDCRRFQAPEGFQINGFFGRSGNELDQLGLIYSRIDPRSPSIGLHAAR